MLCICLFETVCHVINFSIHEETGIIIYMYIIIMTIMMYHCTHCMHACTCYIYIGDLELKAI